MGKTHLPHLFHKPQDNECKNRFIKKGSFLQIGTFRRAGRETGKDFHDEIQRATFDGHSSDTSRFLGVVLPIIIKGNV